MENNAVNVHILNVPYLVDNTYSYLIPCELVDSVKSGMICSLPFGTSNRLEIAIIVDVVYIENTDKYKYFHSLLSDDPILNEEQIKLAFFMKTHLLCTIGDAIKSMAPNLAFSRISESYKCNDEILSQSFKFDTQKQLFEYIKSKPNVSYNELKKIFGDNLDNLIIYLIRKNYIIKDRTIIEKQKEKTVKSVKLSIAENDAQNLINDNNIKNDIQRAIIKLLLKEANVQINEVYSSIVGANNYHIKKLVEKGYISIFETVVDRNYYNFTSEKKVPKIQYSDEQNDAINTISNTMSLNKPSAILLNGITGSGKTNVIMASIDKTLECNKTAIVLLPEIALTPQMASIFQQRYGNNISIIHSSLSNGERYDSWKKIISGEIKVVLGTRSAVFSPLKNIGLIVIDEEQESTYKSDSNPKYLAHDIARYRCAYNNSVLLLSSATPSLQSYYKAKKNVYNLIKLKNRYGNAKLPSVEIVDMKSELFQGNASIISRHLKNNISQVVNTNNQAIIFLNRRGYNNFLTCKSCGNVIKCPNCSVSLTYHVYGKINNTDKKNYLNEHINNGILKCHYCGYTSKVPEKCPECSSEHFQFIGYGTQNAEELIKNISPKISVKRMDMDTTSTKHSHDSILKAFRNGEANVLLGTQMVTKGHDFPKVTLVGVLNADASLFINDYRASERTFSMLTQVIGRAGRANEEGVAIIQTMNPDNDIIKLAAKQDYETFYSREIELRRQLAYPPFCDMVEISVTNYDEVKLQKDSIAISNEIQILVKTKYPNVKFVLYGPFEAPIYRVNKVYKNRFIVKCKLNQESLKLFDEFYRLILKNYKSNISIDFNPTSI